MTNDVYNAIITTDHRLVYPLEALRLPPPSFADFCVRDNPGYAFEIDRWSLVETIKWARDNGIATIRDTPIKWWRLNTGWAAIESPVHHHDVRIRTLDQLEHVVSLGMTICSMSWRDTIRAARKALEAGRWVGGDAMPVLRRLRELRIPDLKVIDSVKFEVNLLCDERVATFLRDAD